MRNIAIRFQQLRHKHNYAIACPGQGFYRNGLLEINKKHESLFREYLEQIDETLGENFSKNLYAQDESIAKEWLGKTSNAQPAILASTYILSKIINKQYGIDLVGNSKYLLGHSLGEYTALLLSGILDFPTALKLVRKRGQLMVVYKLLLLPFRFIPYDRNKLRDSTTFDQVLSEAYDWGVVANINSINQIVISGENDRLIEFSNNLRKTLPKLRTIPLPVSIPFHNKILESIVPELSTIVYGKLHEQKIPIISNVDAKISTVSKETMSKTLQGNYQPVRWLESMQFLEKNSEDIDFVLSFGPGNVLHGINSKYKVKSIGVDDIDENAELFVSMR
ncbi:MCT1 [[Candida] subhashii]|uniref:MCT1 n=1 Tax=[Candida] subhashii TaxID=561895 RepID=A0A8J5UXW2_9ASCO|nr:MCT1 [[Candida] subhashii]KAG7662629.1 MCT1 [[Candida] subhashii]